MQKLDKNCCLREAEVFKALGHPTRLWIVKQLAEDEHCVCEFVESVGVKFATISQHLTILKQAGVIEDEKRGQQVFYHLKCHCIIDMINCISKRK
ncbi:MAG: metalloregulator ArsR/SmtB family transcription factor [Victivallaceae bacterium]